MSGCSDQPHLWTGSEEMFGATESLAGQRRWNALAGLELS